MVEAKLFKYYTQTFVIGGSHGDVHHSNPSRAVYIPSEEMLIQRERGSNMIIGPFHQMYEVLMGEQAKTAYDKLRKELKTLRPQKIDITETLVDWAKALHKASNPPKGISKILDPFSKKKL